MANFRVGSLLLLHFMVSYFRSHFLSFSFLLQFFAQLFTDDFMNEKKDILLLFHAFMCIYFSRLRNDFAGHTQSAQCIYT